MILELLNSFLDRPGNIGTRTARVLRAIDPERDGEVYCIARGGQVVDREGIRIVGMGPLGHLPRILNAIRIFLFPAFNHRALDISLFSTFCRVALLPVKGRRIRLAHVWDVAPNLIRNLKARGIPVVLDVPIAPTAYAERLFLEGRCPHCLPNPAQAAVEQEAYALADRLLVPSDFVADELERLGVNRQKMRVVHFGVDVSSLRPSPKPGMKERDGLATGINWVMLGNVNYRKGVGELLEVWRDPVFAEDTLHLCGRVNPEVSALLKRAGQNVLTPGFVNPADYLNRCHVFVMPSWMEGSSKAVFEAMAMGLPAIVSSSTGSVVREGIDGYSIEAGDSATLKERMLSFKRNPATIAEMGENAREHMKSYSWQRYADTVIAVYDEFR